MTSVSYPGVYVEEIPGGARPIESASTSTAAFVGVAQKGPTDKAVRVTGWNGFQAGYGGFVDGGYLAESVYQFFNNGGKQCYIIRVNGPNAATASVAVQNRASQAGFTISASSSGAWGNAIYIRIVDGDEDSGNTFTISVYTQDEPTAEPKEAQVLAATPVEVFENLNMNPKSPDYVVTRITDESEYLEIKVEATNVALIRGQHIGDASPETAIATAGKLLINVDGDGYQEIDVAVAASLAAICADITAKVQNLPPLKNTTATTTALTGFACDPHDVNPGGTADVRVRLRSGTTAAGSSVRVRAASADNVTGLLKLGEQFGGVSNDGTSQQRPSLDFKGIYQIGDHPSISKPGVDDVSGLTTKAYSDGFQKLNKITDVSMLAVPGVPGMFDPGVTYCENRQLRDIFFIGETELTDDKPSEAESRRKAIAKPNSYGCLFYPWINSQDLTGRQSSPVLLPPAGFVAGLFARIDTTRGVWKAPAGTEASISGAKGLLYELTDVEQGNLNKIGVNCFRRFALSGIVSWGSRTVSSDPEYKYVPVRRTAIMLRRSIYDGIQWAVFEPNDHRLWSSLRMNIGAFMNGLFRAGAFQGEKATDAYFVNCGLGDTMTQGDIDRGMVIVEIGFAALKPAEFVIVRIQQKAGQTQ